MRSSLDQDALAHTTGTQDSPLSQTGLDFQMQAPAIPQRHLPQFGTDAADAQDVASTWFGWCLVPTCEGRLYFHHEATHESQWHTPEELLDVLGEWEELVDASHPDHRTFWRNEILQVSLWKDPRSTTNIFQAAIDGNLVFLQLYADVGGPMNVHDTRSGLSALHYACAGGSTQSALFLVQRGAEVDRLERTATTPLIFACRYGFISVVKILLDSHANLSLANYNGTTALHEAAMMGHLDCLHLLLLYSADTTLRDQSGATAMDLALERRQNLCAALLRRHDKAHGRRPAPYWSADYAAAERAEAFGNRRSSSFEESDISEDDQEHPGAMQWSSSESGVVKLLTGMMTSLHRLAFPIVADLGLPNQYWFNKETGLWELHEGKVNCRKILEA